MGTAGQRCTTLRRLFVHDSVYDALVPRSSRCLWFGDRSATRCEAGARWSARWSTRGSFEGMQKALEEAKAAGGTVHGGERVMTADRNAGCYLRPPGASSRCRRRPARSRHETFAPILYVIRYSPNSPRRWI